THANLPFVKNEDKTPHYIGFKLKYAQIYTYPEIVEYIRNKKNIRIIHLVRENLLHKSVSIEFLPFLFDKFKKANLTNVDPSVQLNLPIKISADRLLDRMAHEEEIVNSHRH